MLQFSAYIPNSIFPSKAVIAKKPHQMVSPIAFNLSILMYLKIGLRTSMAHAQFLTTGRGVLWMPFNVIYIRQAAKHLGINPIVRNSH